MSRNGIRLHALEQQARRVVPPEVDPRIKVSLPYELRRWANRSSLRDLDARWREAGDFHVALRAWCDRGVDWDAPLAPAIQWKERGYARFRRRLGHARTGDTYTLRPGLVVDWSNDTEGEAIDLEELAILGWTEGLDLNDWRFTYRMD